MKAGPSRYCAAALFLLYFVLMADGQTFLPATLVSVSGGSVEETTNPIDPALLENGTGVTIIGETNFYANGNHANLGAGLLLTFQTLAPATQVNLQIVAASFGTGPPYNIGLSAGPNSTTWLGTLNLYSTNGSDKEISISGNFALSGNTWPGGTLDGGTQTIDDIWQPGNLYQFYIYGPAEAWLCPVGTPAGGIIVYDASLSYVALSPVPVRITGIAVNGNSLTIASTNGVPHGAFTLMESTNLLLPVSQWRPVLTNIFNASGDLNLTTNIIHPGAPDEFYLIEQP
jgi:hypothetical protein